MRLTLAVVALGAAALSGPASAAAAHATVVPVSIGPAGQTGNDSSNYADMTPDARFVSFASFASDLVPGDTNGVGDVFVRDRLFGTVERVSVGAKGAEANGDSNMLGIGTATSISDDGRFVAYKSEATNLVRGDRNDATDVFVFDRVTGTTERVSLSDADDEIPGGGDDPSISPDGRYVAFVTSGLDADFSQDVYLRDRQAGTTTRISIGVGDAPPQNSSSGPSVGIAPGGPIVAFSSSADNLVADDDDGASDAFVRDLTGPIPFTERVSVNSNEEEAIYPGFSGFSPSASISSTGRYVVFASKAINFTTPAQTGTSDDIFVRDRLAGTTTLASPDASGGEADGESQGPSISPDGRHVAFSSFASDLVVGGTDNDQELLLDAFVHDRTAGTTELTSVASDHSNVTIFGFDTNASSGPVSADGLVSTFVTNADNLYPGDTAFEDVYVNDRRPAADLTLALTDSPDPVPSRGTLVYTLTISNGGPNAATDVRIADDLSSLVTFQSASGASCAVTNGRLECTVGTIGSGTSAVVTITTDVKGKGTIPNSASVGSAAPDPTPADNVASTTTTIGK